METASLAKTTHPPMQIHLTSAESLQITIEQHHQGHHPIWLFLFPKHRMLPDFLRQRLVQPLLQILLKLQRPQILHPKAYNRQDLG